MRCASFWRFSAYSYVVLMGILFAIAVLGSSASQKFITQLEVYENPQNVVLTIKGNKYTLEPDSQWVALYSQSVEDLAKALKNPDEALRNVKPGINNRYLFPTTRDQLKDIEELKVLAEKGDLPAIHLFYKIMQDKVLISVIPTPVIVVVTTQENIKDTQYLVESLGLVEVSRHNIDEKTGTIKILYELGCESKYDFVFAVSDFLAQHQFIKEVAPLTVMFKKEETKHE